MKTISAWKVGVLLFASAFPIDGLGQQFITGGYSAASTTATDVITAATFAIKAENKAMRKKGANLLLVKISSAQQQVVAGLNFRLELRVTVNNTQRDAEAVVYRNLSGEHKLISWIWKSP